MDGKHHRANLPTGGLKRLWHAELSDAFSSMAVARGRLFTMARDGNKETVVCLDAVTGQTLWKQAYSTSWKAPGLPLCGLSRMLPHVLQD